MPNPRRRRPTSGGGLPAGLLALGLGALLLVAGCSTGQWREQDGNCVYESDEAPKRRVINTVDPELCDRAVKERSPIHLRVPPAEDKDD